MPNENYDNIFSNLAEASASNLKEILITPDQKLHDALLAASRATALKQFGNKIYIRGLIEFTNYCKNDCYYCGIRCSNNKANRYRLNKEQILSCCANGYELGFRTFVLQGGEDPFFSDEVLADIIIAIKKNHPDCALTLSIGERSLESYEALFTAGADRYLLRHETANPTHYSLLHPETLSLANRLHCLKNLKEIGYQVGTGFMVGSPFQTTDNLIEDLLLINKFKPQMIGIGPFIPHHDTPFRDKNSGTLQQTLRLIAMLRLMLPKALIPATTALGTIDPCGREQGILAGANVVMPNLSPVMVRSKYSLYDNKICTGEEAAECINCLRTRLQKIGYEIVIDRGDYQK
ncbi:[FeFe] hydrogenase maturase subunit HydE [bioreactor metagenome]|jgi:iron-only hydrogenase maturation rSAM protein HydE|uniref:[FeFe] hydrogenase maturase subunit HydE n=1 Tax=bioreactor metagenome TaxID=1076179 RepID=A0A644UIR6_9ZZZZ|nr:[FeFe] hydrogenase H-cluster radical SAM maturase HydE [Acidaminococcaceae bacterium]NLU44706.1 [FeFe] hydrogenase H-cluster radical SAM maturase HydE [Acholeplasmataceae bacterium]